MTADAHTVRLTLAGTEVLFETGRIARQASGAVVARAGDSVVLATVVASGGRDDLGFFPLTVEYREKFAAAGRIPGTVTRREGRITDHEVLTSRLIDRSIRSLFPDGYTQEVQVQVSVLSIEPNRDPTTLALLAACAAIHLSPAPANGPAAGFRIVRDQGVWVAFPTRAQRERGDLDFVVSAGPDGLVMVEGEAAEIAGQDCVDALDQALQWATKAAKAFAELRDAADPAPKVDPPAPDATDVTLPDDVRDRLTEALATTTKSARYDAVAAVQSTYLDGLAEDADRDAHKQAFGTAKYSIVRDAILDGRRLDGRGPADIRPIWSETGWLPRTHGSAIFTRGETQALVTTTLGTDDDAMTVYGVEGPDREHFILHYAFPPYSVGEARPLRGPGRREIGHGNLARRGLQAAMPSFAEFPYTVRVESEIAESNGSSSMATVCGGCLALLHAGVPLKRSIAGIAMGLVTDGERTAILSDILGDEDHLGDMDFKVVGTEAGITALQLDNKIGGLQFETLTAALEQATTGIQHILGEMAKTQAEPSPELSPHAPRVYQTAIMPQSISQLIGPRGANIKGIAAATSSRVTVNDDGIVRIYAADGAMAKKALSMVGKCAGIVQVGKYYTGEVSGVKDFGVFVRINDVTEGLVPRDEVHDRSGQHEQRDYDVGDGVNVRVLGIDDRGRLKLSIRAALGVDLVEF